MVLRRLPREQNQCAVGRAGLRWTVLAAAALASVAVLLGGCSEESRRICNLAPDTFISFGPAETGCNHYKVDAYWYGTDVDGAVERFEVATVRGEALGSLDSLDFSALPWRLTASVDSTFVVQADSCCEQAGRTWYDTATWGILVRSVDNEGARDPLPAVTFFQACNQLPKVTLRIPRIDPGPFPVCAAFALRWGGSDADGPADNLLYKYLVIPEADVAGGEWPPAAGQGPCLPPLERDSSGVDHAAPPVGYWSEWVPADCTLVEDINLTAYAGSGQHMVLIVTAKDEAGALLPEELYQTYNAGRNWVEIVVPAGMCNLNLWIDGGMRGQRSSGDPQKYADLISYLYAGTEVRFSFGVWEDLWSSVPAKDYRYYFDDPAGTTWNWMPVAPLRQPGQLGEWHVTVPSGEQPLTPSLGPHILVAEVRDKVGTVSHCEFKIQVLSGPQGKDNLIYLVDDDRAKFLEASYPGYEQEARAFWSDALDGYTWESFSTQEGVGFTREVPASRVGDASTVIWVVDQDTEDPETHLTRVCAELGNYLDSYVKVGGNLIIIGKDPVFATMYWPDGWYPRTADRSRITTLDLTPRVSEVDSSWVYHFLWETFGIVGMRIAIPPVAFKTAEPCEDGWGSVTTDVIPGVAGWPGRMDNAFYITEVREDMPVHKLYSVIPIDAQGNPTGPAQCGGPNTKLVGVWVPGDSQRGHAAYIGIPPWFFNHGQVKTMIRHLLEEFGEAPVVEP